MLSCLSFVLSLVLVFWGVGGDVGDSSGGALRSSTRGSGVCGRLVCWGGAVRAGDSLSGDAGVT